MFTNSINGFYCGSYTYNKILHAVGSDVQEDIQGYYFVYKDLRYYLDRMAEPNTIIGIGEPYATLVDKLRERFS